MSEDQNDKQFDATEQKLQKARKKGDIPRSVEANTAIMYLGIWLGLAVVSTYGIGAWLAMAERSLGKGGWSDGSIFELARSVSAFAGVATFIWIAIPAILLLIALIAMRSLIFSPEKLSPDMKRINPIHNAGQKFGKSGLIGFFIATAKAAIVCVAGIYFFASLWHRMAATSLSTGDGWLVAIGEMTGQVLLVALAVSALFGTIDFLWKRHEHRQRNRMSRTEMEDEHKESEGDPQMKASRRRKAVEVATRQMITDVAKASVVIVNPTHYAVALEWSQGSGRAPVCLAKGTDDVAARIRRKAIEHNIPIWSDPPCARAINANVKIGQEIKADHFAAVATAIRFALHMNEKAKAGW